jgi:BirA family biotin operon repressor/biotin-[acetyl-CoA-carboxylase] ligase
MPDASPLSIQKIATALGPLVSRFDVDVLAECDSTNARLLERAEAGAGSGTVIAAERQTAGRGRMGRTWFSAPGDSVTFSLLWRFASGASLSGLSLAVGVAVAETLREMGVGTVGLKWPNDILLEERKVGGILVELISPLTAVIGIGLNYRLPDDLPVEVRTTAAALDCGIDRNDLLARLLLALRIALEAFSTGGFRVLRPRWLALNAYAEKSVRVLSGFSAPIEGRCMGVAEDGALLLETGSGIQRVISGDVSLRLS